MTRSCPELFRVTGPLLSLVLRTEDVWQRYNQYGEVCGALNQGFPFSQTNQQLGNTLVQVLLVLLVLCVRGNGIIHRAHKAIQLEGDDCRPRRSSRLRFPWLTPIRNSFELRCLYRRPGLYFFCVCLCVCLLLQDLLQSCSRGGEEESGRHVHVYYCLTQ